jgi:hypothetical protein
MASSTFSAFWVMVSSKVGNGRTGAPPFPVEIRRGAEIQRGRLQKRSALADEAKARGLDLPSLDQPKLLERLDGVELLMEVGTPLEEALREATVQLLAHRAVVVQPGVLLIPPAKKPLRGRWYVGILRVRHVPAGRSLVHPVEGVFVDDEDPRGPQELGDPVEATREVMDVMQRSAGDHSIERPVIVEVLECYPAKDRSRGRLGIDGDDAMTGSRKRPRQLAASASDLQYPTAGRREVAEHECVEARRPIALRIERHVDYPD